MRQWRNTIDRSVILSSCKTVIWCFQHKQITTPIYEWPQNQCNLIYFTIFIKYCMYIYICIYIYNYWTQLYIRFIFFPFFFFFTIIHWSCKTKKNWICGTEIASIPWSCKASSPFRLNRFLSYCLFCKLLYIVEDADSATSVSSQFCCPGRDQIKCQQRTSWLESLVSHLLTSGAVLHLFQWNTMYCRPCKFCPIKLNNSLKLALLVCIILPVWWKRNKSNIVDPCPLVDTDQTYTFPPTIIF